MKTEWRIFIVVALFLFVALGVYAWWTDYDLGAVDWIGSMGLALAGMLCLMCAGYFWFVSRRIDPRPEDRDDAEISDGAGEIGFFSPGSYWPIGVAAAAVTAGTGLVFKEWWLVAAGLLAVLAASGGLLFEYYTGTRKVEH
ncbi:cytochrome c oxidase subunit 4 [Luedemannella helvata]|uniref:Cytochrome c oxidase polypeptide 4 n=1 Tax=Luedemannella helvata TaxID=349315 RepID=A0ABN2JZF5_9ACTN